MLNLTEFAAANSSKRITFAPVQGPVTFQAVNMPPEKLPERLEEGDLLQFPSALDGHVVSAEIGGHTLMGVQTALLHKGATDPTDYLWYPQTWLKSYRRLLDNGTTSPDVVRWGGSCVDFADLARKQGYDAAVQSLLGRTFRADNCREFQTRGYDRVRTDRVFDMVEIQPQQPQQPQPQQPQ